jgi:hypothetical protein
MKCIVTLAFLILAVNGFSQNDTDEVTSFIKEDFSIQYPKSWQIDTSKMMGTELFVFSALENENDKFRENVNVIIQDLGGQDIDLDKYKQITETQVTEIAADGKIYESTVVKTGKGEYYKVTYAMTQGTFRLKISSYCYIKNEKAYLVTFSSEFDKYDQYKKVGEQILKSFSLTE